VVDTAFQDHVATHHRRNWRGEIEPELPIVKTDDLDAAPFELGEEQFLFDADAGEKHSDYQGIGHDELPRLDDIAREMSFRPGEESRIMGAKGK
jgi:hypothetical protein